MIKIVDKFGREEEEEFFFSVAHTKRVKDKKSRGRIETNQNFFFHLVVYKIVGENSVEKNE